MDTKYLPFPNRPAPLHFRPVLVWWVYGCMVILYALCFPLVQVADVPLHVHTTSTLLAAVCFLPMAIWLTQEHRGLPMFELICLSYAVQYSFPVYLESNEIIILSRRMVLPWDTIFHALSLTMLGVGAMIVCYYLVLHNPLTRKIPRVQLSPDPYRIRFYIVGVIVANTLLALGSVLGVEILSSVRLGAVLGLIQQQVDIVIIILAYQVYRNEQRNAGLMLLLYGLLAARFLAGLQTGMLEHAFIPVAILLIVVWHSRKKIPWVSLGIGMLLLLVMNQAKHEYRARVWFASEPYTVVEKVLLWGELSYEQSVALLSGNTDTSIQIFEAATGRMNTLKRLAHVLVMTPDVVPYYEGASYEYLIYTWVPRIIWPEKPSHSTLTNQMDIAYMLKAPGSSSSINIGFIAEAYANYGALGVPIVLALNGVFLGIFTHMFNTPNYAGSQAIYAVMMISFLNGIGSSISLLFGSMVQKSMVYAVILRLFTPPGRNNTLFPVPSAASVRKIRR